MQYNTRHLLWLVFISAIACAFGLLNLLAVFVFTLLVTLPYLVLAAIRAYTRHRLAGEVDRGPPTRVP